MDKGWSVVESVRKVLSGFSNAGEDLGGEKV